MSFKTVSILSGEIGYPEGIPGETTQYWHTTPAPSGATHPNLQKPDLEALAKQWLEAGAGEEHWPSKARAKRQTWAKFKPKITENVQAIFVRQWQIWKQNEKAKERKGVAIGTSPKKQAADKGQSSAVTGKAAVKKTAVKSEVDAAAAPPKTAPKATEAKQATLASITVATGRGRSGQSKKRRLEEDDEEAEGTTGVKSENGTTGMVMGAYEITGLMTARDGEALRRENESLRAEIQLLRDENAKLHEEMADSSDVETGFHDARGNSQGSI